ncbi:elongation factor P hydroxylase [Acinetobacter rudis]|uniref:Elongation factor P hydroxylase n=1 Tax=Acinetobacter rudis TaxID=632955 RepID=A0AAW8J5T6_9GAMM|nr:elongation factor P hydroxylase [Acinetobacter rudis]MDQ8935442.1 elongation factor P hydroxylase [Acinetobacter rudis]MDQ9017791.1 elongation factor P hydroxylase [Acinetobacter rudis]
MPLLQKQAEVITSTDCNPIHHKDYAPKSAQQILAVWANQHTEQQQVDWLILHFNHWFSYHNVHLVRGDFEPEYFPATLTEPARIQFAHGFFNSALHEISHWSIAGAHRRTLPDLGYWYAPDGRSAEQQQLFEKVEIVPQAIEWMFATAFARKFRVSLDNLTGEAGQGESFKDNVFAQVEKYFSGQATLPRDAAKFIQLICLSTRQGKPLSACEFSREMLN